MALSEIQRGFGSANMLTISYHTWSSDPFYNSDALGHANVYGVGTTTPWTWCDGTLNQEGTYGSVHSDSAAFAGYYNSRHGVTSPVSITVTGKYNSSTRTGQVKASVTNTGTTNLNNQKLFYVIVESVPYNWEGVDTCWTVERKMLPSDLGLNMTLLPDSTKVDSQSFTMGSSWVDARTRFAVFLSNGSPGEIRQGAWVPLSSFTGVEMGKLVEPEKASVALAQNRPNPFKGTSEIEYNLPSSGEVRLALYDAQGRLVRILADGTRPAGTYQVKVSGLGSGVYFYRLEAGNTSLTRRMVVTN